MDIRVVGSGTMGNGIDQLLATSGSSVVLYDVNYEETGDSKFRVPPLLRKYVRARHFGRKRGKGFDDYSS